MMLRREKSKGWRIAVLMILEFRGEGGGTGCFVVRSRVGKGRGGGFGGRGGEGGGDRWEVGWRVEKGDLNQLIKYAEFFSRY
jgi:hypothetical protein